jgi:hypothetical protein
VSNAACAFVFTQTTGLYRHPDTLVDSINGNLGSTENPVAYSPRNVYEKLNARRSIIV